MCGLIAHSVCIMLPVKLPILTCVELHHVVHASFVTLQDAERREST